MTKESNRFNLSYDEVLKQKSRSGSIFNFKRTYPAYIILVVLLFLSYLIYDQTEVFVDNNRQQEFNKAVTSVETRLESKKQRYLEIMSSISGLYDILPFVVRDYFELYSSIPTLTYPSILSIVYAPEVENAEKSIFIHNMRSQGYYEYKLRPEGERPVYFPVEYVVPLNENPHILGKDYYTDKITEEAIKTARDSNQLVSTPFYQLRQPDTTGFFMINPIYQKDSAINSVEKRRRKFKGAVIIEIMSNLYFQKAIEADRKTGGEIAFPSDTSVIFKIVDNHEGSSLTVFKSENYQRISQIDYQPALIDTVTHKMANRELNIVFATTPNFGGKFQTYLPLITLIISLIISFTLFGFIATQITSKAKAIDLADRMTRSQRRIVETSNDIIAIFDVDRRWKTANQALKTLLGFDPQELSNEQIDDQVADINELEKFKGMVDFDGTDQKHRIDLPMKIKNSNDIKWISWDLNISKEDNLIYALGRDVTLEKETEKAQQLKTKQISLAEQFAKEAGDSKSFFVVKISHQLRNSLTSILGYLEMLQNDVYDNEEERQSYLNQSVESTEEVYTFVSDLLDANLSQETDGEHRLEVVHFNKIYQQFYDKLQQKLDGKINADIRIEESTTDPRMFINRDRFNEAMINVYLALTQNSENMELTINIQENEYEGSTELQIMGSENIITEEMIILFKSNQEKQIDILKFDKDDVLFSLGKAASSIRRLNGSFNAETFGGKEGNIVMINLPISQTNLGA